MSKLRLLWVGDAGCPSGFALATHKILDTLRHVYDVTVLGINYRGDPHSYPYPIYAAAVEGDMFGLRRLIWMCDLVKPDVIVLQNDPWNIPGYTQHLQKFSEYTETPVIGSIAVDGKNCMGAEMNDLSLAVFWSQFGLDEAREGGFTKPATVIPLGVDIDTYYPMDRRDAFDVLDDLDMLKGLFIVGNVNRNQPRKRWDLCIRYFAEWVISKKITNARLYLHTAPTGETSVDVRRVARYYGVLPLIALREPPVWYGLSETQMRATYNIFDLQVTTTQGEGFGLTTLEGMACGVPQIVPQSSSLEELTKDAAIQIPCTSTAIGPPYVGVVGSVVDERLFIETLDVAYHDDALRMRMAAAGLARAHEAQYRWEHVGRMWLDAVHRVLVTEQEEVEVS